MSSVEINRRSAQFLILSVCFWAFVLLLAAIWRPTYRLMAQVIRMHSEYSLLEQGTKVVLLVMLSGSLIAYRNEDNPSKVRLSLIFTLFAFALYFSESNFIDSQWQPIFGAFFILLITWQLLRIDRIALVFMICGCLLIAMGMLADVLQETPGLLPTWTPLLEMASVANRVEEHMDLWGAALLSYACLVVFRDALTRFYVSSRLNFALLIVSVGLIASGNSFAHWQYNPGNLFEIIATAMAVLGLAGMALVDRRSGVDGMRFGIFDSGVFYFNCALLFVVLPVIYGGMHAPLNLLLWLCFFVFVGNYLFQSHPVLFRSASIFPMSRGEKQTG